VLGRGDDDERDIAHLGSGLDQATRLDATETGHRAIEQDAIDGVLAEQAHRFLARRGTRDVVATLAQAS
jgi:hypothetical protein